MTDKPVLSKALPPAKLKQVNQMHFDVIISPNPSVSDFKLQIITSVIEKTTIKILGIQGRLIKEMILSPYQKNISIGSDLNAGTYIIEVKQGKNIMKTKLLKF